MTAEAEAVAAVENMLDRGEPFGTIEDFIESQPIKPDLKNGLWLIAWAESSSSDRRQVIASLLPS